MFKYLKVCLAGSVAVTVTDAASYLPWSYAWIAGLFVFGLTGAFYEKRLKLSQSALIFADTILLIFLGISWFF